jgi:hypothetical protein
LIFHHLRFIYTSNGHVVSLFQQNHVLWTSKLYSSVK